MNNTLRALIIRLTAQQDGTLPGTLGELAHAAFYAAVEAVDPALSAQMHDAQQRAAFALSPLYGVQPSTRAGSPGADGVQIRAGQEGWLRLSLLDDDLFGVFMRHLLDNTRPSIRLGPIPFAITEVLGNPSSHPWAGYTTLDELQAMEATASHWVLEFASPTAIRWGEADNGARRVEVFPQPRMAIAGLRSRWDKWTSASWGRDFEEWVERNVVVGRVWQWQTRPFRFQKQTYTGGTGKLEYRLLDPSTPAHAAHFNRLLHLAFYTGIGYKTTHGLGQVRLAP